MERKDWNYKTYLGDCIDGMRLLPAGSVDFLFTETRGEVKFDTWQFAGKGSDAITNTEMEDRTPVRYEYYHPNGMRLTEQPATGMYIRKTYYSDGSVKTDKKLSEH